MKCLIVLLLLSVRLSFAVIFSCDGDSLTYGTGSTNNTNGYPAQILVGSSVVVNNGVPGEKISDNTNAVRTLATFATVSGGRRVAIFCEGINDIATADSSANIIINIGAWINTVRTAYPDAILIGMTLTYYTGASPTILSRIDAVNAYITGSADFDYVVDLIADPRLIDPSNMTYYKADGVHRTDAGYGVVAELIDFVLGTHQLSNGSYYVRSGGAGSHTGADWSNAWDISEVTWTGTSELSAGDTLWVAGGNYTGAWELKGSGVATNLIYVKRARTTDTECTSAAGWSTGFDSQVILNPTTNTYGIYVENTSLTNGAGRYITVDGRISEGIKINLIDTILSTGIKISGLGNYTTTFRYIAIYGPSTNANTGKAFWTNEVRGFNISADGTNYISNITLEYLTISGLVTGGILYCTDGVIYQNSDMNTIECITGDPHGNLIYMSMNKNLTIRWNQFHDSMFAVGLFMTYLGDNGFPSSNIWIYANIFRDSTQAADRAIEVRTGATGTGPLFIYNNTLLHINQGININDTLNTNAMSYIENNLCVDIANGAINGTDPHLMIDYNITTNSTGYSWVVNAGATNILAAPYQWQWVRDLHLVNSTPPVGVGIALSSPFNVDYDGTTQSTPPSIGAYANFSAPFSGAALMQLIPNSRVTSNSTIRQ